MYKNELSAFSAFVEIDDSNKINTKSIRYQFLEKAIPDLKNDVSEFYIIEANSYGEVVKIKNYVVHIDKSGVANINIYNYMNSKWVKDPLTRKMHLLLDGNLGSYATKFGLGFNQSEVIVTHFDGSIVITEYFPYGMLSKASSIREILLLK